MSVGTIKDFLGYVRFSRFCCDTWIQMPELDSLWFLPPHGLRGFSSCLRLLACWVLTFLPIRIWQLTLLHAVSDFSHCFTLLRVLLYVGRPWFTSHSSRTALSVMEWPWRHPFPAPLPHILRQTFGTGWGDIPLVRQLSVLSSSSPSLHHKPLAPSAFQRSLLIPLKPGEILPACCSATAVKAPSPEQFSGGIVAPGSTSYLANLCLSHSLISVNGKETQTSVSFRCPDLGVGTNWSS